MRRLLAAAGVVALLGIATPALASTQTYGNPYTATTPKIFNGCGEGNIGITYSGTLVRILVNSPEGPVNNILGGENFVIQCQPLSGSVTIQLQRRNGNVWANAGNSARFNFPTTDRGFGLSVGPYYCQGSKTSWRIAIFSSGVAGDGTKWGPATDFDSAIGGSSGKYFNCG